MGGVSGKNKKETYKVVEELFADVGSKDFLGFSFGGRSYQEQLNQAIQKTGKFCAVTVEVRELEAEAVRVIWIEHDFGFLGGSLGCAEGEKLTRAFEYAREHTLPVVASIRSGGARMQEGTLSLMQMAKVAVAVQALRDAKIPYVSILHDPTYGGVSASYAMESDVRIAMTGARIGFAGPAVILNTMFEQNQAAYDRACPIGFQTSEFLQDHGQVDTVVSDAEELQDTLVRLLKLLWIPRRAELIRRNMMSEENPVSPSGSLKSKPTSPMSSAANADADSKKPSFFSRESSFYAPPEESMESMAGTIAQLELSNSNDVEVPSDYTLARQMTRYQAQDIVREVFEDYLELQGDGKVGNDPCIKGGVALLDGKPVIVITTIKGHNPMEMQSANYGMPSPAGYRIALRLMELAEHFQLPVVSLVDTPGALPSFDAEMNGQSEAIATNLTRMAALTVPVVSLIVGEGGSGGALGICMGNVLGMMSRAWFSVISPEGAASILGRYKDEDDKAARFPEDCRALANVQGVYADRLVDLGVVDVIIDEDVKTPEQFDRFPIVASRIRDFFSNSINTLSSKSPRVLVADRYAKFRRMGKFEKLTPEKKKQLLSAASAPSSTPKKKDSVAASEDPHMDAWAEKTLKYVANQVLNSAHSTYQGKQPLGAGITVPEAFMPPAVSRPRKNSSQSSLPPTAKHILDKDGPDAVVEWMKKQKRVMVTDTTMRDAHQSLLATRVRSTDFYTVAEHTNEVLRDAFSLEMWGGATFDVAYRFLHEDPWERLRELRKRVPDVMFQMLVRGSNAVGYTNYADNVVEEFIRLAAKNGMDVFRIFDCFNDVEQMKTCIKAVRKANKLAEACICFTGNFLNPKEEIYTLEYYRNLTKQLVDAGTHIIGVKDMAGLLKPQMAKPLMEVIRSVTDIPVHFHTHNTSSASLATNINMANNGCSVVDCAIASMSDTTSQPSMNAFLSSMEGDPRDTGINYLSLERLDLYWAAVRELYSPFESGLKAGTARVYDHQIPGGQYSNLIAQCKSIGIWDKWELVLDMYRDVNNLFGDIVKVTPSSKCVGDLALFLINKGVTAADVLKNKDLAFPKSVVELMKGDLGVPHRGWPKDVQAAILKGEKPLECLPGKLIAPVDFAAEKEKLQKKWEKDMSEEDVISAVLYPKVFNDYQAMLQQYGDSLTCLPSGVFLYGMQVDNEFSMKVPTWHIRPGADAKQATEVNIKLKRVGPLKGDAMRTITFQVGKKSVDVTVKDENVDTGASSCGPQADKSDPRQVGSPMPGTVDTILVDVGDKVEKGQKLMVVAAMKMEVSINAAISGTVEEIVVKPADKLDTGTLVMKLS